MNKDVPNPLADCEHADVRRYVIQGVETWRCDLCAEEFSHPADEFKVVKCCKCGQPHAMPMPFMGSVLCEGCDTFLDIGNSGGIWLRSENGHAIVCIEHDRKWVELIRETMSGPFSHICEPLGIDTAIKRLSSSDAGAKS